MFKNTNLKRMKRIAGSGLCMLMAFPLMLGGVSALAAEPAPASATSASTAASDTLKEYMYHNKMLDDGVGVYVGTQLMQVNRGEESTEFVPILFGLENLKHRGIDVARDRIRLYDRYGNEVPLASLKDVRKEYGRQRYDRRILSVTNFAGQLERTDRQVATNFFPLPGEIGVYRIQVPQWGYMMDLLYFKGDVNPGERYRLVVDLDDMPEMSVDFSIPQ